MGSSINQMVNCGDFLIVPNWCEKGKVGIQNDYIKYKVVV